MAGRGVVYGGGDTLNRTQKLKISSHDQPLDSMCPSASPSKSFLGPRAMLSFGPVGGVNKLGNSIFQSFDQEDCGDEYFDEYFHQPEKKRRLTVDQVQFLEKSFDVDNKLEPERKIQLAKELGLQPRQIAIWFQNRRARWKTRQLETDYETLHASFKNLKNDYDNLVKENEKLKAEVLCLKHNGLVTEKADLQLCDTKAAMISKDEESKVSALAFKNEEQSSGKNDSANVDSPVLSNGIHSSLLESGDSSNVLDRDQSDLSHHGEELLRPDYNFAKIEVAHCHTPASSFHYGFPVEDHGFGFW